MQQTKLIISLRNIAFLLKIFHSAFLASFLVIFVSIYVQGPENYTYDTIVVLSLISSFYGFATYIFYGVTSVNFLTVYGAYLIVSHQGIIIARLLDESSVESFAVRTSGIWILQESWYYSPIVNYTVTLSSIGIIVYFLIANLMQWHQKQHIVTLSLSEKGDQRLYRAGLFFLILSIVYLLFNIFTGTLSFGGLYGEYFTSSAGSSYASFLLFMGLGIILAVSTGNKRQVSQAFFLFSVPSVLLFIAGSRSPVLYSLAASMAVLGKRGYKIKFFSFTILFFMFIVVIPAIRSLRQTPINQYAVDKIDIATTDFLIETGFQLRPFGYTVGWIMSGEDYAYGRTYLLPLQRMIGAIVPFFGREDLENNRYFIGGRLPTQGYSVIAEAFYNFGIYGVIIVPATIAYLLSKFNSITTSTKLALAGSITQILINNQRNSFIFVPAQVVTVILVYYIVLAIGKQK